MFDTHCHLNFKAFADDAHQVAQDMTTQGIRATVVGCDPMTSRTAVDLGQIFDHLWSAVGLHPIHVLDHPWDSMLMKELALEERVVAIGEVGLDFYRFPKQEADKASYLDAQYATFRSAIELAQQVKKPLILHSRQAYDEMLKVLAESFTPQSSNQTNGTIHCFMGDWNQAKQFLELGFMVGLTGVITYNDVDPKLLNVVKRLPLDHLVIETDAPYLTPEPYRTDAKKAGGRVPRNIPAYVRKVAEKIAEIKGMTTEEIVGITEENAKQLFKLEY